MPGGDDAVADGAGGLIAGAADDGNAGGEAYGRTRFTRNVPVTSGDS